MAYETGVANGVLDLLGKIRVFAQNLGWTIDRFNEGTTDWELALHHLDAGAFTMRAIPEEDDVLTTANPGPHLYIYGQTGFDPGVDYANQPGTSQAVGVGVTNALRGPFTAYHLFGTTGYLHVVVEMVPGEFAHAHCGRLAKLGEYTGGEYVTGTRWYYGLQGSSSHHQSESNNHAAPWDGYPNATNSAGAVRYDAAGYSAEWARFEYRTGSASQSTVWGPMRVAGNTQAVTPFRNYLVSTPNTVNAVTPLQPLAVTVNLRDALGYMAGSPADLRQVNMKNLVPGETLLIGNDEWMVFPVKKKGPTQNGPTGTLNSWWYGYAYRKVA